MSQPDVPGRAFPSGDWNEPSERLDELYVRAEQHALLLVDRCLADRTRKRRGARALRAGAALGTAAGAVIPLLVLGGTLPRGSAVWGHLALLCAALCLAGDRCLGLTSGWTRNDAAARAVVRRLESLRYEWATEAAREALGPAGPGTGTGTGEAAVRGLSLLHRFTDDVSEIVRTAAGERFTAPGHGPVPSQPQQRQHPQPAVGPRPARPDGRHGTPGGGGVRPSVPRQRPPES